MEVGESPANIDKGPLQLALFCWHRSVPVTIDMTWFSHVQNSNYWLILCLGYNVMDLLKFLADLIFSSAVTQRGSGRVITPNPGARVALTSKFVSKFTPFRGHSLRRQNIAFNWWLHMWIILNLALENVVLTIFKLTNTSSRICVFPGLWSHTYS
jgi:hypothetical protein